MKLSDFGTDNQKQKLCKLTIKSFISCSFEQKCYYEKSNLINGDIIFKSPRTRNKNIRELKEYISLLFCGK